MSLHKPKFWISIIFAAGILYLLSLHLLVSEGVYFVGDAGLKAMITQNLAAGSLDFSLNLPNPPWIRALWDQGMYPYGPPFIYQIAGKYYTQYPFTFSLISAPFYAAFGFRGLYIIPFLSTVIIWLIFYRLCKRLDFAPIPTAVGLFFLIFATYLSLYGGVFWEHTLSVCLAFAGLFLIFPPKGSGSVSVWALVGAGLLTGLAVWFRPEQIFVVIFLDLLSLFAIGKGLSEEKRGKVWQINLGKLPAFIGKKGWIYLVSSTMTLLLYGLSNLLIYQNFFGVHSIQVLEQETLVERFLTFLWNLRTMTVGYASFFLFTPIALFLIGFLFFALTRQGRLDYEPDWTFWYGFILLFIPGVSAIVPISAGGKQWGPRFLLFLAPVVTLLFTWQLDHLLKRFNDHSKATRWVLLASIVVLGVFGIIQNPLRGRNYISDCYNLSKQAIEDLRADHEPLVAASAQQLSQVFQPALDRNVNFLTVMDWDQMARLSKALLDQHQDTFTYICYPFDCKLFDPNESTLKVEQNGVGYVLQTLSYKDYGRYAVRKLLVRKSP